MNQDGIQVATGGSNKIARSQFIRLITFVIILCWVNLLQAFSIKDRMMEGNAGSYAITAHGSTYTVLILRSITPAQLQIDEIAIAESEFNIQKISWIEWLQKQAPGHSSWTTYIIDTTNNTLSDWYSHTQKTWLYIDDPNQFLSKLLSLNLEPIATSERKKIGPPPPEGEPDHRKFWQPQVTVQGKLLQSAIVSPVKGQWPNDQSIMANTRIEMYFSKHCFPCWIDVKSPHYTVSIRTVDSGDRAPIALPNLPEPPPQFVGPARWVEDHLEIYLKSARRYTHLQLFAISNSATAAPIFIPSETSYENNQLKLTAKAATIKTKLKAGENYRWLIVPDETTQVVAESPSLFSWQ